MTLFLGESVKNQNQIFNKEKYASPTQINHFPLRYGSAADIPYGESFDLKSIIDSRPNVPSNNIMDLLKQSSACTTNINELLDGATRDRENRLKIAKKTQADFMEAMNLN
ncbi:unnamed protein product [Rotaria magnacalcarata]|uniref:Uncharacterized protein n=1 Tax=Rotaria magnacalcarata TaxID=392030 RepID=A0A814LBA0_9BILA|nr:unnamed protein product [Rotaria magnacalcarata]CAF1409726.1 unnamed protein product [Rotaria magnacalcarata]CAF2072093.1 unnamed protein product [Rotaria magnacalcarata]CAF2200609.1 unnamed protein product [Rotaria magnacalcarata]CAF3882508.1 unnamed protein product [Rotaria magnacalcarata]